MFFNLKKLILIALVTIATSASAYEVLDVCATYKNTGKSYKVEARFYSGNELNQRTKTFNYEAFSNYVVIFWGQGQASVIELDYAIGGISPFGSEGKDQNGYKWEISSSTSFCY